MTTIVSLVWVVVVVVWLATTTVTVTALSADSKKRKRRRAQQHQQVQVNHNTTRGNAASHRIVNGQDADRGAYPFFAQRWAGTVERGVFQGCGGALIATRWVLSAAHCVPKLTTPQWRIGAYCNRPDTEGRVNCGLPSVVRQSVRTLAHPRYDPEIEIWDFALFQLDEHVHELPPVVLDDDGSTSEGLQQGDPLRVVGFGNLNDAGNEPVVLKQVDNLFLPFDSCASRFRNGAFFDESILCSNGEDFGPCQGDSGSPVLVRDGVGNWIMVGLNSFGGGSSCENHNNPDVAARVATALPWIRAVICPTYRGPNARFRPPFCPPIPLAGPTATRSPVVASPPPPSPPTPATPMTRTKSPTMGTTQQQQQEEENDSGPEKECAQDKKVRFSFWGRRHQFDNKMPRCKKIKSERQKLKFCDAQRSNATEICKQCLASCQFLWTKADS